jgi:cellulose biosynthesis protein BcsQ
MTTPVLAYLTMKGGVGKTTLAANVTRALAELQPRKILLIDADAQCNLSQIFYDVTELERDTDRTIFQALESRHRPQGPSDLKRLVYSNVGNGSTIDLIVGSYNTFKTSVVDDDLVRRQAAASFSAFMDRARAEYDMIVFDTNPSATFMTLLALEHSNFLVAPITYDTFAMQGINLITQNLQQRYQWLSNPRRIAIVPNKVPRATRDSDIANLRAAQDRIAENFPLLAQCVKREIIHETSFLVQRDGAKGFLADRRPAGFVKRHHVQIVSDIKLVAQALQKDIRDAFGTQTQVPATPEKPPRGFISSIFNRSVGGP